MGAGVREGAEGRIPPLPLSGSENIPLKAASCLTSPSAPPPPHTQTVASGWLRDHPAESRQLLDLLTTVVIDYTSAQIEAGADMMQVWGGGKCGERKCGHI